MSQAERLSKEDALARWRSLDGKQVPLPCEAMKAVPYAHTGSAYAFDGIRINGSRKFIDSTLAALQNLLGRENSMERIGINYTQATDFETHEPIDSWVCFIRVHDRGQEKKDQPAWTVRYRAFNPIKNGGYVAYDKRPDALPEPENR
jgi:hypothetical protein